MISTTNNNSMLAPAQSIQLNALNADALKYLGGQVGKVIEAKVISVSEVLTNPTPPAVAKSSTTSDSQVAINARASAERAASNTNSVIQNLGKTTADEQNTRPRHYQVVLEVDNQRISVKSPLAPRLGQLLQMQVINYQTLALIAASAKSDTVPTPANPGIAPVVADSPQTNTINSQSSQLKKSVEILQQALRSSLPKQLPREALNNAFQQLLRPSPQPATNYASNSAASKALLATANPHSPTANTQPNVATGQAATNPLATIQTTATAHQTGSHTPIATTDKLIQSNSPTSTTDKKLNASPLPATIKQALNHLERAIPHLNTIVRPEGAKNALLNSGLFFEARLGQLLAQQNTGQTPITTKQSNISVNPETSAPGLQNAVQTRSSSPLSTNTQTSNSERLFAEDLKHQFTSLANTIKSTLSNRTENTNAGANALASAQREILSGNAAIALLWQLDNAQIKTRQPSSDNDSNDAIMQLLRLALGHLARTQNHQLQATGSQLAANNEASTTQTLTTELPFWHQGAIHILDIRVDQEQANKRANEKTQAWNLRLRFDLEELGELVALATLQDKTMAAVFWASEKTLANKLSGELEQLNNTLTELGIEVKQLHCQHGRPDSAESNTPVNLLNTNLLQEKS